MQFYVTTKLSAQLQDIFEKLPKLNELSPATLVIENPNVTSRLIKLKTQVAVVDVVVLIEIKSTTHGAVQVEDTIQV